MGRCFSYLILTAMIAGCPAVPYVPPVESPQGPFALEDYFPIAKGNTWTWRLYTEEAAGEERFITFSMTVDDVIQSRGFTVWHAVVDAPWYVIYGFAWLLGDEGRGYAVVMGDRLYFMSDREDALERIAALPDLTDWEPVPLFSDLSPREIHTESDDKPLIVRYYGGYYPDALPEASHPALLPPEYRSAEPIVLMDTSERGIVWQQARMVLGYETGVLFGVTSLGNFYLSEATLAPEGEEGEITAVNRSHRTGN